MVLQLGSDYLVFDGLQAVSYFVRVSEPVPTTGAVAVANCLRVSTTSQQQQSMGLVGKQSAVWHLWSPELGAIGPKVGDVIQDAQGVRWSVLGVEFTYLTQHYVLTCLAQR